MPRRNPFKRSVHVPTDVLNQVRLGSGEKVLAGAIARDGTWLLGTRDALLIVDPSLMRREPSPVPGEPSPVPGEPSPVPGEPVEKRIPWQQIEKADWDGEAERLKIAEVGEFGLARPEYSFEFADPGLMLELIRERVTASVVLQRRVLVSGNEGLFVVARRAPRGEGEITWVYEFDPGVNPEDPGVMEAAGDGLDAAAEQLGL